MRCAEEGAEPPERRSRCRPRRRLERERHDIAGGTFEHDAPRLAVGPALIVGKGEGREDRCGTETAVGEVLQAYLSAARTPVLQKRQGRGLPNRQSSHSPRERCRSTADRISRSARICGKRHASKNSNAYAPPREPARARRQIVTWNGAIENDDYATKSGDRHREPCAHRSRMRSTHRHQ